MGTRLERSRPIQRGMAVIVLDANPAVDPDVTVVTRLPRLDPKGYPSYNGYPSPTLVALTKVDTTP